MIRGILFDERGTRLALVNGTVPVVGDEVVVDEETWRVVRRRWLVYEDPEVSPQIHLFMARGPNEQKGTGT